MKVVCRKVPPAPTGETLATNPWVTVGAEYVVASVQAVPGGRVLIQIITDDGRSLAWFDSLNFEASDGSVPDRWTVRIGPGGTVALAPASWLVPGFWEAYYDGDPSATQAVEAELRNTQ